MHIVWRFIGILILALSVSVAQADSPSGADLKAKLSNTTLTVSKNGRKTRRRLEIQLRSDGTGGSLHVPSGQLIPVTWQVKGRNLCVTQQRDGKEFCMATLVTGSDIVVQMQTGGGKTRQLKGTIDPL